MIYAIWISGPAGDARFAFQKGRNSVILKDKVSGIEARMDGGFREISGDLRSFHDDFDSFKSQSMIHFDALYNRIDALKKGRILFSARRA